MSHSEALSRLTVGDRRNDLIRWVLRRAIARSSGTGSTRHDRRANVSNSQVRPGPRQSLPRIVVGGTAVTFDHGWAQADEAPGPHHGSARTARRVVVSTSEAQKAYAETGLALRTGIIGPEKFLPRSDKIRHRIRLKPKVETRSNHRIICGNTAYVFFVLNLTDADSVGALRISNRTKEQCDALLS